MRRYCWNWKGPLGMIDTLGVEIFRNVISVHTSLLRSEILRGVCLHCCSYCKTACHVVKATVVFSRLRASV